MPLNPTGSEIPRSLTNVATTIDVALDGKADFAHNHNCGNASTRYGGAMYDDYDYFVDSAAGNDSNDGTNWAERRLTFRTVQGDSSPGDSIGVLRNQKHKARETIDDLAVGQWRPGNKPTLHYGKYIGGVSWGVAFSNAWGAVFTLSDDIVASSDGDITNFNTYFPGVWVGDTFLDWRLDGTTYNDQLAAVAANAGSFAIQKYNDIAADKDIRKNNVPAANGIVVYVHLPDSTTPVGKDIWITDTNGARVTGTTVLDGLKLIGNWSKDFLAILNAGSESKKIVRNCEILDFGSHGCVGPFQFENCLFRGAARRGMAGFDKNQAFSAINLYTPAYYAYDMVMSDLDISNVNTGIYGHTTGTNIGYKSLTINGDLKIRNATYGIQFDDYENYPFLLEQLQCNAILDVADVAQFCEARFHQYYDGGGTITLASTIDANRFGRQRMFELHGGTGYIRVKDTVIDSAHTVPVWLTTHNVLVFTDSLGGTLELDNVQDANAASGARRFVFDIDTANHKVHLILKNGTVLGDLVNHPSETTHKPLSLTVGAGCRFGWGGRTGPQIESFLTAQGVTHNISGQTTIVDISNNVLSSPGWK
jgi:hypothetical protein